jgi:hypothetical protein
MGRRNSTSRIDPAQTAAGGTAEADPDSIFSLFSNAMRRGPARATNLR